MAAHTITPNERVTFRVHHEDADLLIVEKPARVVTTPGVGHEHDTLLNGLFVEHGTRLQNLGASRDFGMLHRLDRETSGLLVVALSVRAYDALRKTFESRDVRKFYWALTPKAPSDTAGVIRRPIIEVVRRKDRYTSQKLAKISTAGKPALTAYRVLASGELGAIIEARPVTGRLHQVRVHLKLIGCPILGDEVYAPQAVAGASPRLALHAHRLAFDHPITGAPIDVRTRWPNDLKTTLRRLSLPRPDLESSGDAGDEVGGDPVGDEHAQVGEDPPTP
ncbi:MAG: RluA family pseudouridine synthase [Phycisphaerales bacterium]